MDPLQKILNRLPVKLGCHQAGTNPFIVGCGNTRLRLTQRIFVMNFSEDDGRGKDLFQGIAGDRCQGGECNRILEKGNRYNRCRSCLRRLMDDFNKSNFRGDDPTSYLDQFRRDKKIKSMSHRRRRGGLKRL